MQLRYHQLLQNNTHYNRWFRKMQLVSHLGLLRDVVINFHAFNIVKKPVQKHSTTNIFKSTIFQP